MGIVTTFSMDDSIREDIKALKRRAVRQIFSFEAQKKALADSNYVPIGDNPSNLVIAGNHKIVFSLEEHPRGLYKHLSVSCTSLTNGRVEMPHPNVVSIILKEFGFKNIDPFTEPSENFIVWKEAIGKGIEALNIVEKDSLGVEYLDKETLNVITVHNGN